LGFATEEKEEHREWKRYSVKSEKYTKDVKEVRWEVV
jgi:hypothetical protein